MDEQQQNGKYKISFGQNSKNDWNIKEVRAYSDDKKELELDIKDLLKIAEEQLKKLL